MKKTSLLLAVIATIAVFGAWGCGAGGGHAGGGGGGMGAGIHSAFDGTYATDFTRAPDSSILIFVTRTNTAEVVVSNASGADYYGSGTVDPNAKTFTATLSSQNAMPVQVTGSITTGSPYTMNLTLTGGISRTLQVQRVLGEDLSIFAGTYKIKVTPDQGSSGEAGSGTFVMDSTGGLTGAITTTSGAIINLPLTYISPSGIGGFQGKATLNGQPLMVNYTIQFWMLNGKKQASGGYQSSNNSHGTFTCTMP